MTKVVRPVVTSGRGLRGPGTTDRLTSGRVRGGFAMVDPSVRRLKRQVAGWLKRERTKSVRCDWNGESGTVEWDWRCERLRLKGRGRGS